MLKKTFNHKLSNGGGGKNLIFSKLRLQINKQTKIYQSQRNNAAAYLNHSVLTSAFNPSNT
jgi:hypothetical protein